MKQTGMPGVFICGDAAWPVASVAMVADDDNPAGSGLHRLLMFGSI